MGKARGWAVLAEAGGSVWAGDGPIHFVWPESPWTKHGGRNVSGRSSSHRPCYFPGATSSRKPALVSLAGWGTSLAPGAASPCRHHLSLGGLSPWRLGTVCGPWLCVRWGLCTGLGVGCQWSRWSGSPRKWGGREGRGGRVLPCSGGHPQGATAAGVLGQGARAQVGREGTSRKSLSHTDEMALIPGGEKGPASSPFSQLQC